MSEQTAETPAETESDFGRGLTYCLGLFLAHAEGLAQSLSENEMMRQKYPEGFSEERAVEMWFNAAADHLGELETGSAPTALQDRLAIFQSRCIHWRLAMGADAATLKDAHWAIQEAKDLLRLIDESHGVPVCQGTWE